MPHTSDKTKILNHLQAGNSITFLDCERLFHSISLRERIMQLRREGKNIKTRKILNPDTGRFHVEYYLEGATAQGA
jgi:ribosomal protein L9